MVRSSVQRECVLYCLGSGQRLDTLVTAALLRSIVYRGESRDSLLGSKNTCFDTCIVYLRRVVTVDCVVGALDRASALAGGIHPLGCVCPVQQRTVSIDVHTYVYTSYFSFFRCKLHRENPKLYFLSCKPQPQPAAPTPSSRHEY